MIFILYKLYIISPKPHLISKTYRNLSAFLHFEKKNKKRKENVLYDLEVISHKMFPQGKKKVGLPYQK